MNNDELTIVLGKPVTAHGEEIDHITLRAPTTADLIELGQPMRLIPGDGMTDPAIDVRMNVVANYVARLATIPLSSVKAMSLSDFGKATQAVLGFFGEGSTGADVATEMTSTGSSPRASSTSPGSSKPPRATS